MIQLIKDFKWLFIAPVVVLALVASLVIGITVGGRSSSDRLSKANLQLQQVKDDFDKIQSRLSMSESKLAQIKDNGEESFYKGAWFFCMALTKGTRTQDCFAVATAYLIKDAYHAEPPGWDWSYVQDAASGQN